MGSRVRGWLGRLEKDASKDMESFELKDGSRYTYDRMEAMRQLYLFAYDSELGLGPEPPEVWTKLLQARDPEQVLSRFRASNPQSAFVHLDPIYREHIEGA